MTATLQARDLEILRTLYRLEFVTTRELAYYFFSAPRPARRRLKFLSDRGYITPHARRLAPGINYTAWRLHSKGVAALCEACPDENVPPDFDQGLLQRSLYNLHHRTSLTELYLGLLTHGGPEPSHGGAVGASRIVRYMRARADAFTWHPDGATLLTCRVPKPRTLDFEQARIVPDATLVGGSAKVRVFVELDRSTKRLKSIEATFALYARFLRDAYGTQFSDGRLPFLLYVVRSEERRNNLRELAQRALPSGVEHQVLLYEDALAWLGSTLHLATAEVPRYRSPASALRVYERTLALIGELVAAGQVLPVRIQALLPQRLYDAGSELVRAVHATGHPIDPAYVAALKQLHSDILEHQESSRG